MPTTSSFLPRLGFSRTDGPILPLHGRSSPPIRKKPSEYDLAELPPQPDEGFKSPDPLNSRNDFYSSHKSSIPSPRYSDSVSNTGSASKSKPPQRLLFAGPPPPIATSRILYRDEEEHETSHSPPRDLSSSSFARSINSVLFDLSDNVKGKGKEGDFPPPLSGLEEKMFAQLDKMRGVMASLEEHLAIAEEKGWNLLKCAIGAELEAFKQAESMLREALRAAGFDVGQPEDDGDQAGSMPHLGRSTSLRNSSQRDEDGRGGGAKLVDLQDEEKEPESDNEVPLDLLVSAVDDRDLESPALSREDGGNDVSIKFLMEHPSEEYPGLGVMS
ncbi:Pyruvate kinase [Collariella sp. IMI 366227]|nr:Pyruvate kinase [Collariella sp. IMI 366227]